MERDILDSTAPTELQIIVEDCMNLHEANIPAEHRPAWRQMVTEKINAMSLLDTGTRPSHSDVLQVVVSSFVYVKQKNSSIGSKNPFTGNLEELQEKRHCPEKRRCDGQQKKEEEEEGSPIVVMMVGPGQTSDLCEIDTNAVFGYVKNQLGHRRQLSE